MSATACSVATLFIAGTADALALTSAWLGATDGWEAASLLLPVAVVLTVLSTIGVEMLAAGQPS
jgi:hypothetical protein